MIKRIKRTLPAAALFALAGLSLTFAITTIDRTAHAGPSRQLFVPLGADAIQFAGEPVAGSRVYFIQDSGPNAGKPRPAVVLRSYVTAPNQPVDLIVYQAPDDGGDTVVTKLNVTKTGIDTREPGHWDWMIPSETGF